MNQSTDQVARGLVEASLRAPRVKYPWPTFLHVEGEPENRDLVLQDQESFWITVNGVSVYVQPTERGVRVDLFPLGGSTEAPIDSCEAEVELAEMFG
jgi:hypothetical protein